MSFKSLNKSKKNIIVLLTVALLQFNLVTSNLIQAATPDTQECYEQKCQVEIQELGSLTGQEYEDVGYETFEFDQCIKVQCEQQTLLKNKDQQFLGQEEDINNNNDNNIIEANTEENNINNNRNDEENPDQENQENNNEGEVLGLKNGKNSGDSQFKNYMLQDCNYKCGNFLKNEKARKAHECALKCAGVDTDKKKKREAIISVLLYITISVIILFVVLSCVSKCLEAKHSQEQYKKQNISYSAKKQELQQLSQDDTIDRTIDSSFQHPKNVLKVEDL